MADDRLEGRPMAELVALYNEEVGPATPATEATFSSVAMVIRRIRAARLGFAPVARKSPATSRLDVVSGASAETTSPVPKSYVDVTGERDATPRRSVRLVRVAIEELLLRVVDVQNGVEVGMPYSDILDRVKDEFPEGRTNMECVRWYATAMRERGERLPARPISRPRSKK